MKLTIPNRKNLQQSQVFSLSLINNTTPHCCQYPMPYMPFHYSYLATPAAIITFALV
jgi:hypothetical protein